VSYRVGGTVFEKRIAVDETADHADRGAAVQVYLCDDLRAPRRSGPLRDLAPEAEATHRETWTCGRSRTIRRHVR
jgi:hypothetical protein